jgi:aerobic-type carbon monoxide dehydrogenase small subunit (CoxS/CutS family)
MNMIDFLNHTPAPTSELVREALVGNVCRCGDYQKIVSAVLEAAQLMRAPGANPSSAI